MRQNWHLSLHFSSKKWGTANPEDFCDSGKCFGHAKTWKDPKLDRKKLCWPIYRCVRASGCASVFTRACAWVRVCVGARTRLKWRWVAKLLKSLKNPSSQEINLATSTSDMMKKEKNASKRVLQWGLRLILSLCKTFPHREARFKKQLLK